MVGTHSGKQDTDTALRALPSGGHLLTSYAHGQVDLYSRQQPTLPVPSPVCFISRPVEAHLHAVSHICSI